jgi:3'-phosphoadenosine 5'-phosphosulfate sulfotransferase (PAPS reductase)/FAD synthetase
MKHIVGFSGGIDSQACARWVLNRYPAEDVILLNSDAGGNEHRCTTQFIDWYSENVHSVVRLQATVSDLAGTGSKSGKIGNRRREFQENDLLTFERLAYIKGRFPSRTAQFCTQFLKLNPQNRWIKANISSQYLRYSGVRREEGVDRRKRGPVEWDDYFGTDLHHPLVDWTKQMCFDYVAYHGEKINELYTLGFSRVGCAPCVNANKDDILAWVQRSPDMIDKVRDWEVRYGFTFFAPVVPGLEINWIDQVVEWSKTMHGGKQLGLHVLYERPACESDYGLCE